MRAGVLAAAVLAAGAAGAIYVYHQQQKKNDAGEAEDLAPALTEEETLQIMQAICDKVKMIAMRMLQASENIKAQLAQQGQEMDDRKLMKTFIYQHFVDQLEGIQSAVLSEFDAEESELEDAVNTYVRTEPELREIVEKIKTLHYQFGGDKDEDDEEGDGQGLGEGNEANGGAALREIPLDELIEVIEEMTERISDAMDDYISNFKDSYGVPDQSNIEQFQQGFMQLTEKVEKKITQEHDIPMTAFQKAIEKNSHQPLLQQAFMKMQLASHAKMTEHGLQM